MRGGTNLTEEEISKIINLRSQHYSLMDIAAIMGRSKATIKRVLKKNETT